MNSLEDDTLVAIKLPWQGVVTLIRPVEPLATGIKMKSRDQHSSSVYLTIRFLARISSD